MLCSKSFINQPWSFFTVLSLPSQPLLIFVLWCVTELLKVHLYSFSSASHAWNALPSFHIMHLVWWYAFWLLQHILAFPFSILTFLKQFSALSDPLWLLSMYLCIFCVALVPMKYDNFFTCLPLSWFYIPWVQNFHIPVFSSIIKLVM